MGRRRRVRRPRSDGSAADRPGSRPRGVAALHRELVGAPSTPVLLNPATGVNSDQNYAWNYERAFKANGIPYCTTTSPVRRLGDIQTPGDYIVYAIRQMYATAGRRIAIMGHSQGGMVMRWALRFWPDTRRWSTTSSAIAGSNHGTTAGRLDGTGQPANLQQADNSNFTRARSTPAQETFAGIDYTDIYTHTDEVVKPNDDSNGSSLCTGRGGSPMSRSRTCARRPPAST